MIHRSNSFCDLWVTDRSFGPVIPGDRTVPDRLSRDAAVRTEAVVWMNQVHGTNLEYARGDGDAGVVLPETDGVWTDRRGVMLVVKTADCGALLLWSEQAGVAAALHCGWRSYTGGLIEQFGRLCADRGFDPAPFSAFLGPHLRVESFEVRQDFIDRLPPKKRKYLVSDGGGHRYDLTAGILGTLGDIGVTRIEDCGVDTFPSAEYYSYRAWSRLPEDKRGERYRSFASAIVIR